MHWLSIEVLSRCLNWYYLHEEQVLRERIKELVDFATTESPYRDANKGWLSEDVYVQLGSSPESSPKSGVELANVSVFWNPINQLALILLVVVLTASTFVFISVSFAHGRFETSSPTSELSTKVAPVVQSTDKLEISQQDNTEVSIEVAPTDERKLELDTTKRSSEFAAAALGGQQIQR